MCCACACAFMRGRRRQIERVERRLVACEEQVTAARPAYDYHGLECENHLSFLKDKLSQLIMGV